jgi:hypothetical protein
LDQPRCFQFSPDSSELVLNIRKKLNSIYTLEIRMNFDAFLKKNQNALLAQPSNKPTCLEDNVRPRLPVLIASFRGDVIVSRE